MAKSDDSTAEELRRYTVTLAGARTRKRKALVCVNTILARDVSVDESAHALFQLLNLIDCAKPSDGREVVFYGLVQTALYFDDWKYFVRRLTAILDGLKGKAGRRGEESEAAR